MARDIDSRLTKKGAPARSCQHSDHCLLSADTYSPTSKKEPEAPSAIFCFSLYIRQQSAPRKAAHNNCLLRTRINFGSRKPTSRLDLHTLSFLYYIRSFEKVLHLTSSSDLCGASSQRHIMVTHEYRRRGENCSHLKLAVNCLEELLLTAKYRFSDRELETILRRGFEVESSRDRILKLSDACPQRTRFTFCLTSFYALFCQTFASLSKSDHLICLNELHS